MLPKQFGHMIALIKRHFSSSGLPGVPHIEIVLRRHIDRSFSHSHWWSQF